MPHCVYFVPNSRNELFSAPSYLNPQALNFFLFLWGNFFFSNYLDNQNPYIYFLNVLDTIKYVLNIVQKLDLAEQDFHR